MILLNRFARYFLTFLFGVLLGSSIGLVIGIKVSDKNEVKTIVTEETVIRKINNQAFLITTSVINDSTVTITIDQGSGWSNFWWGHEVEATGLMQVDVGVNLEEVTANDITINEAKKEIQIDLPDARVYDSSLKGEIEVATSSGVFKKLFDSDDNEDYNLALDELKKQGLEDINNDTEILSEAKQSAITILESIFAETGYKIVMVEEE